MNELIQQSNKIPDPSDEGYKKFIRYVADGGAEYKSTDVMILLADMTSGFNKKLDHYSVRESTDKSTGTNINGSLAVKLFEIADRISKSVKVGGDAVFEPKDKSEDVDLEKLQQSGMIVYNKDTNKAALTKSAVEVLLFAINKVDEINKDINEEENKKNNIKKPPIIINNISNEETKPAFTLSQFRYVDPSVLGEDAGKTAAMSK
ncbi:MAG: hypothetical protein AABY33_07325 [Pseudomonadota bacterium]